MPEDEARAPDPTTEASRTTEVDEPAVQAGAQIPREEVTLDLDAYVLEWFQAQGEHYEDLMNQALRDYIETEDAAASQAEPNAQ